MPLFKLYLCICSMDCIAVICVFCEVKYKQVRQVKSWSHMPILGYDPDFYTVSIQFPHMTLFNDIRGTCSEITSTKTGTFPGNHKAYFENILAGGKPILFLINCINSNILNSFLNYFGKRLLCFSFSCAPNSNLKWFWLFTLNHFLLLCQQCTL